MKEKILVALKTKYKTLGFSDRAFDGVADYLSKTVTEESQIETAIGGVEGLLRAFQGDVDFVRNEKSGLQRQLDELKKQIENPKPEPPKPEPKPDEKPDIAKLIADGIAAGIKPFSDKLAAFEAKEAQAQRMAQITSVAKKYGISEKQAVRYAIPADADLDTYFKDVKQELANDGYQQVKAPETAEQQLERETSEFAKMIENDTKQIVEQQNK